MVMVIGLIAAVPDPVVKEVIIGGDPVIPIPTLWAHLDLRPGIRYSDAVREKDIESVKNLYQARHLELGSFEGGIEPGSVDAKADTATVKYNIYVARVAAVRIIGAGVNEAMLRKLLQVRPGMVLNTELVKADEHHLQATGMFGKVKPNIENGPNPRMPQDVTLVWVLSR